MFEGVTDQDSANPEKSEDSKNYNFRRLEQSRDAEREARIRAEAELSNLQQRVNAIENRSYSQEKDPLDDIEDYVDKDRLKLKLAKEREAVIREAEAIAKKTYENLQQEDRKKNYLQRLQDRYSDFDDVMNFDNIKQMSETSPEFAESLTRIQDEYERRELAYKYIKRAKNNQSAKASIANRIDDNMRNPYHIPSAIGSGSHVMDSGVVEFNPKDRAAKDAAYAKLKSAKRNPVGGGLR